MERLRAALIGCILTGGVLFGARPPLTDDQVVEPVVASAGLGGFGRPPEELARWCRPLNIGTHPIVIRPPQASAVASPGCRINRTRCNAGSVRRRARY